MKEMSLVEIKAANEIAEMLQYRTHIFQKLQQNEDNFNKLLIPEPSAQMGRNFLMVLRRWNSYTPAMVVHDSNSKGGGYFLVWKGAGIVIDPGFNFIENFYRNGFRIVDIDSIIITHAHIDHCVELESLLTLLYEYNDRQNREKEKYKKVNLYLNVGSFKKFESWITSCHKDVIHKIHMLEAGVEKKMPNNARINIKSTPAIHDEIWDDKYCVGLVFKLFESNTNITNVINIGITSDTSWTYEIQEHYRDCSLLVLHLGGIKSEEIFSDFPVTDERRLYKYHLGAVGTSLMLHNLKRSKEAKLKLIVISEFGEELKGLNKEIVDLIRETVIKHIPDCRLDCIIGDIGTKIMLSTRSPELICEQKGCNKKANLDDVLLIGGVIAHFCPRHTPVSTDMELLELLHNG
jgi:hypothetical protein